MEARAIYDYISLGTTLRYLQDVGAGKTYFGKGFVQGAIRKLLNDLKKFELPVTLRASGKILEFRDQMNGKPKGHKLSESEAKKLAGLIKDLRTTLAAEAKGNVAYIVSSKRYDAKKLIETPEVHFAEETFERLSEIAQFDLGEAAKCIAFERSTAAAFHLMRATEAVLRDYYCSIVKQRRLAEKDRMWGPMVKQLRDRRQPPPKVLLDHLDNIRNNFRNPTQHPEKIYSSDEVQDLFGVCIDVINRMSADL